MELINELIDHAQVYDEKIVKVDHLINHKINVNLLNKVAIKMAEVAKELDIDKIVTIETGGIAIATLVAMHLELEVVYAKKQKSLIFDDKNMYCSELDSFTKEQTTTIMVDKRFIKSGDKLLFVDDFLASGSGYQAIKNIIDEADANLVYSLFVFNKSFQNEIEDNIYSVVNIKGLTNNKIELV